MEELGRGMLARMLKEGEVGSGPTEQPHAMLPVVDHVVQMLTPTMPRDVTLNVETGEAAADMAVHMTPLEMQQVVLQLVLNAREAHGTQAGVVAIAIDRCCGDGLACRQCERAVCGSHVRLQVRDSGPGMDADTLARAFEPFYTTKTARKHAGLGLSIVQALTHKAGGQVRLHSAPEQGTICEILLPRATPAAPVATASPSPATTPAMQGVGSTASGRRIWLVTPNVPTEFYLTDHLQGHGLDVRHFDSAKQCLSALTARPDAVDVLLVDDDLPEVAAPALIRRARALRPDLLCVLCSQPDQACGEAATACDTGAQVVLPKPFVLLDLLRAVLTQRENPAEGSPLEGQKAPAGQPESAP